VVDGVEGKEYRAFNRSGVLFSPDSRRLAYPKKLSKQRAVVDGVETKEKYGGFGK